MLFVRPSFLELFGECQNPLLQLRHFPGFLLQPPQHTGRRSGIVVVMDGLHYLIVIEPDFTDLEMQIAQPGAEILRRGIGLYDPELSPEKPGEDESGFVVRTSRPLQHVQKPFVLCLVELEIVVIPAWIGTAGPSFDLLCHRIFDFEV